MSLQHSMRHNFFTYGTLMLPKVRSAIIGPNKFQPATLEGYKRATVHIGQDKRYPIIEKSTGACSSIAGLIVYDVSPEQWLRLDLFEEVSSGWYVRESAEISLSNGEKRAADLYVTGPALMDLERHEYIAKEWQLFDEDEFVKKEVMPFLAELEAKKH